MQSISERCIHIMTTGMIISEVHTEQPINKMHGADLFVITAIT